MDKMLTRLVAHRIRGFGSVEGSLSNLHSAIARGVKYFEIDTRHTLDDEIVVYHSPCLSTLTNKSGFISKKRWDYLAESRFKDDPTERPAMLAELLQVLADFNDVEIWIDIKDFGLEYKYVSEIRKFGLTDRIRLISWIPQTIMRIYSQAPDIKLGLSYTCTARHRILHKTMRAAATAFKRQGTPLKRKSGAVFADMRAIVPYFHPLNDGWLDSSLIRMEKGYNHTHIIPGLPGGEILQVLCRNAGALGMFPYQVTEEIVEYTTRNKLRIYVYSIDRLGELYEYLRKCPVDYVFTNNADLASRNSIKLRV